MTGGTPTTTATAEAVIKSRGVSPWELEVAYGYLNSRFEVRQEAIPDEEAEPGVVSMLSIGFPYAFSEQFFEWFDYRRWEKLKGLFREMKRRRGSKRALLVSVSFAGSPSIRFVADSADRQIFDNSIEKIDFVLELLPYHLDPASLPEGTVAVTYRFDGRARKWRIEEGAGRGAGGGGGQAPADAPARAAARRAA